jgi:hypothetical protein
MLPSLRLTGEHPNFFRENLTADMDFETDQRSSKINPCHRWLHSALRLGRITLHR